MTIKEYEIERDAKERTEHYQENIDYFECRKCGKLKQIDEVIKIYPGEFECTDCLSG